MTDMGIVQTQTQLKIPETSIEGFCYPFARALLERLIQMKKEGKLFYNDEDGFLSLGSVANSIIQYLASQTLFDYRKDFGRTGSLTEINRLIDHTKEFLSIFEEET